MTTREGRTDPALSPLLLDTALFAPAPRPMWEAVARTRPGVELITTRTGVVRTRRTGSGPTVVLFPDGPNGIEHYDELVARLAPEHDVLVVEIPGFGFSWATDPMALTFDGTVDACVEVLDQLGVTGAVLAGICVQAHVALAIAVRRPDLARALLLSQATGWSQTTSWAELTIDPDRRLSQPWEGQALWRRARERAGAGWYQLAGPAGRDMSDWQRQAIQLMRDGASNSLASLLQAWLRGPAPALAPVAAPTVLLWGAADRTHARAASDPGGLLVEVPHAELQVWDDAGHFLDIEHPARWAHVLRGLP